MRIVTPADFTKQGNELLGIMNRWLPQADWQLTTKIQCDECGAKGDRMIRIEVPISKRKTKPHDICAACLEKALEILIENTPDSNANQS